MVKIMIVDDERLIKIGLKNACDWETYGYQIVGEASNGAEGLQCAKECKPDIVLTDIAMPVMNGLDMISCLQHERKDIQFVILSGYNDDEYLRRSRELGVTEYVFKLSLEPEALLTVLNRAREKLNQDFQGKRRDYTLEHRSLLVQSIRTDLSASMPDDWPELFGEPPLQVMQLMVHGEPLPTSRLETAFQLEKLFEGSKAYYQDENSFGLVFHYDVNGLSAEQVRLLARDALRRPVSVGVSTSCMNAPELRHALMEAYRAMRYCFYSGENSVHSIRELPAYLPLSRNEAWSEAERMIVAGRLDTAHEMLENLLQNPSDTPLLPPDSVTTICTALIHSEAVMNQYSDQSELPPCRSDTRQHLLEWMSQCLMMLNAIRNESRGSDIATIIDYVDQHYREPIHLTDISQLIYKNSSYISHLFKKKMNIGFVDYLTQVRIQKACEKLLNTDLTVVQIAEQTGIDDAAYFCRVFKKIMGQSPRAYRERKL